MGIAMGSHHHGQQMMTFFFGLSKINHGKLLANMALVVDRDAFRGFLGFLSVVDIGYLEIPEVNGGLQLRKSCIKSGWWFGCHFLFSYILGIIIPIDFHIFRRG